MAGRTVIVAGATGLVGTEILEEVLADQTVATVHSLGRRAPARQHPKLASHVVDFAALTALPPADEVYLALGTTMKIAGSANAFRAVDFNANLSVAEKALAAGVRKVGLVSAMGADANSRIFYSRVKGELEQVLSRLPFDGLVIARPSMLVGDRASLGRPVRRGEVWAAALGSILSFLIPENYKPIRASSVARALLSTVPTSRGKSVLLSGSMRRDADLRSDS